jgi:hypothetical protein
MPNALNRELDCYLYQHKIKFYVSKPRVAFRLTRKLATFVIRQVLVGSKIDICRRSLLSSHSDSHCPSNYPSHSVLQLTTHAAETQTEKKIIGKAIKLSQVATAAAIEWPTFP